MKEILAIIPARGGSKGVPRKNIRLLNGHPLIEYTINEAKKSKYISKIVVSSDDMEILKLSEKIGGCISLKRSTQLAGDKAATVDVIFEVLKKMENISDDIPDYIMLLQPTSPFRTCMNIDESIEIALKEKCTSVTSVCEAEQTPYWMKIIDGNRMKNLIDGGENIVRRQDLKKVYILNGAIYLMKREAFLKEKRLVVEDTWPYIMDNMHSLDIDSELDFEMAEMLMKKESNKVGKE